MEKRYNDRFKFECREICDAYGFNLGNVFKYLYRCQDKGSTVSDLKKAIAYIDFFLDDICYNDFNVMKLNSNRYEKAVNALSARRYEAKGKDRFTVMQIEAMYFLEDICSNALKRKFDSTEKLLKILKNQINTLIEIAERDKTLSLQK